MADAALSIAPSPAPMPVVADASATVAATTASEAGADPFASLLATLASTTAPVATAAAMPAVTPSPAMPVATLPTGPKDGAAAPSADPKAKAKASDSDDAPSDPDPLAAAIAAGATAVLAMARIIPTPAPAPAKAAAPVVRAIATSATAKAADLPLTKEPAPADPAQQTAKPGAANTSAATQAVPASGQAPTQPDAATITAILKALPIAAGAGAGANTDTPAPKKADQIARAAATPQTTQPRADRTPPPPFAAGHNGGAAQPVAGKPARADDRRADAGDVTLPGLFTGPQHDAAALSGSAPGPGQTAAPDSIVQQQLSIAQDGQWLDTLARDIAQTAGSGNDLHFKLDPQNLGTLTVSIAQGSDGAAIRMSTDSADTRAILIDAQPKLVAEARAQGLRISEAHVDLSQSNSGSRGGDTWSGQSNAQANGQGQQSSTGRQPFMRNPEPMLAGGAGSDADPDGLYA